MDLLRKNQPPLVSPKCIFNEYFREGRDSLILKVLLNTFQGARNVWPAEWDDPVHFVLTKTLGFSGIMRALPDMVNKGRSQNDLSVTFFSAIFERAKRQMEVDHATLTSEHFSASASGEAEFREIIRRGTMID